MTALFTFVQKTWPGMGYIEELALYRYHIIEKRSVPSDDELNRVLTTCPKGKLPGSKEEFYVVPPHVLEKLPVDHLALGQIDIPAAAQSSSLDQNSSHMAGASVRTEILIVLVLVGIAFLLGNGYLYYRNQQQLRQYIPSQHDHNKTT